MKVIIDDTIYIPAPAPSEGPNHAFEAALVALTCDHGTVRDMLFKLLSTLWSEVEDFDGKRPFGDSGWIWDIFFALANAGVVQFGEPDDEGGYDPTDEQIDAATQFVTDLIHYVFYGRL